MQYDVIDMSHDIFPFTVKCVHVSTLPRYRGDSTCGSIRPNDNKNIGFYTTLKQLPLNKRLVMLPSDHTGHHSWYRGNYVRSKPIRWGQCNYAWRHGARLKGQHSDVLRVFLYVHDNTCACSRAFATTHALMFTVPVFLLAFDGAVTCVPTTMVHRFLFAVVAL